MTAIYSFCFNLHLKNCTKVVSEDRRKQLHIFEHFKYNFEHGRNDRDVDRTYCVK